MSSNLAWNVHFRTLEGLRGHSQVKELEISQSLVVFSVVGKGP